MEKKTVIVTGASKGIGRAICAKLLAEGYHVIGISRNAASEPIEHAHFEAIGLDLGDIKNLPEALKSLSAKYQTVQGIVCNAGQGLFKHLEEFSFEQIRSLIDLNFLSHVYLIKAFLSQLKKQEMSTIVFIGSEAALSGKRQGSLYCASKFALRGFAQALRDECAASPVRVCLINPGMVQTAFFDQLAFKPGPDPCEHILPEDIAEAVSLAFNARQGTVFDEINVSPQKKHIIFSPKQKP